MKAVASALPSPSIDDIATPPFSASPTNVSWDIETLNLARDSTNHIVQYGAVVYDPITHSKISTPSFFVRPVGWQQSQIGKDHHLRDDRQYWENIDAAKPLSAYSNEIFATMNGQTWIGHNILSFDIPVLESDLGGIDAPIPHPVRIIDTLVLLESWGFRGPYVPDLKLATLMQFYGIGKQTHQASDDCIATYDVLVAACASKAIYSIRETKSHRKRSPSPKRTNKDVPFDVVEVRGEWVKQRMEDKSRFSNPPRPEGAVDGSVDSAWNAFAKVLSKRDTDDTLRIHAAYKKADNMSPVEILCLPTAVDDRYGHGYNIFYKPDEGRSYRLDRFSWVRIVRIVY
jgi:DNA polymerase III epsilon subunit-like protein